MNRKPFPSSDFRSSRVSSRQIGWDPGSLGSRWRASPGQCGRSSGVLPHPICRLDPIRTPQHGPAPQVATVRQIGSGPDSTRSDPTRNRSGDFRTITPHRRRTCGSCRRIGSDLLRCPDTENHRRGWPPDRWRALRSASGSAPAGGPWPPPMAGVASQPDQLKSDRNVRRWASQFPVRVPAPGCQVDGGVASGVMGPRRGWFSCASGSGRGVRGTIPEPVWQGSRYVGVWDPKHNFLGDPTCDVVSWNPGKDGVVCTIGDGRERPPDEHFDEVQRYCLSFHLSPTQGPPLILKAVAMSPGVQHDARSLGDAS